MRKLKDKMRGENEMNSVVSRLRAELDRLKHVSGMGHSLGLLWDPYRNSEVHGKVVNGIIRIYDEDEDEALLTLKHEFFDQIISKQVIEPLVKQINMQNKLLESIIYERKENLVDSLVKLMDDSKRM